MRKEWKPKTPMERALYFVVIIVTTVLAIVQGIGGFKK